ncbi:OMA87-like protein [Leptospira ryugenii]|uniref:OMA87-like protein n=2 Tax=Leptospira ryugenii TaxID=1917863 RepID=A0A2P2E428_9LEPT|nr:OMA87-like protein [Leptospira ryugenii]
MDPSKQLCKKDIEDKKEGYYLTGLPLVNSDPNEGIGYGARAYLYNNGPKTDGLYFFTPYRTRLFGQYFNTNKNAQYHQISLDMPFVADTQWRLRADAFLTITPTTLYFGIGENSMSPLSYLDRNQPDGRKFSNSKYIDQETNLTYYRPGTSADPIYFGGQTLTGLQSGPGFVTTDRMYNRYTIETPMATVSGERSYVGGTVRLVAGLKISDNIIRTYDGRKVRGTDPLYDQLTADVPNAKTRLTEDNEAGKILGYHGGYVNSLRLGFVYDTRDFEPDPNSGIFAEVTYEKHARTLGSDFEFNKYFAQIKHFWSPFPKIFDKLVVANRFGLGLTDGEAPFFEYRNLWGTEGLVGGLGGLRTLRGYKQDRFVGRTMGWGNTEIRWKFAEAKLGSEFFTFNLVPFLDYGRVWDDEHKLNLKNYFYSQGLGLRIAWNQATIIMIDYAKSREDEQLFVNFSHVF